MPSATDRISETGQEEHLANDVIVKPNIRDDCENAFLKHSSLTDGRFNAGNNACSSSGRPTAPHVVSIPLVLSSQFSAMTAEEAFQRCRELELQLLAEQKMVSNLKYQLEQTERMLSQLRSVHSKCPFDTKFEDLPEELIVMIFSYLSSDLLLDVVSQVCHQWQRLCRDRMLWSKISVKKVVNEIIWAMTVAPCLQRVLIPSEYLTAHDDDGDEVLQ
ncbi:Putative F-box protein L126, partial [Frankliniella fusca]